MKKNILAVIILAATLVNLTLTAMIVFTFIPYVQKANNLITNILQVIDLDLESPNADQYNEDTYDVADLESKQIMTEENTNLLVGSDGKTHYAEVTVTLSINTKHEDYTKKNPLIDKNIDLIKDYVRVEINKYSSDNCQLNKEAIEKAVLTKIQEYLGSKFIVKVTINMLVK